MRAGKGACGNGKAVHAASVGKGACGNGKAVQAANAENQFWRQAENLWLCLQDFSQPSHVLEPGWKQLMACRNALLQAHSSKGLAGGRAGGRSPGAITQPSAAMMALPAATAAGGDPDWKGTLMKEHQAVLGRSMTKEDMVFEVQDIEDKDKLGHVSGYKAKLSLATAKGKLTFVGGTATKKKLAEQMACKSALKGLYPSAYSLLSGGGVPQGGSTKRKAETPMVASEGQTAKGSLNQALSYLLDRSAQKDDTKFETSETEDSMWVSQVVLSIEPTIAYHGDPQPSKKAAENAAAQAALDAIQETVAPLEAEHRAKKARLMAERIEKLKAKKKEEKQFKTEEI